MIKKNAFLLAMLRVLIIGELEGYASLASKIAFDRGARVMQVHTISEALKLLRQGRGADIALADIALNMTSLLCQLEQERFSLPVIACGICEDPEEGALAIRAGAKEYLPLPPDADLIATILESIIQQDSSVICQDPVMKNMITMCDKVAPSEANILITGESGTGKEIIARYLHKKSKRYHQPFIAINCAAIPDNLLESELFGHEKGSFTGALARRIGKFEEANGGTLLLDEITEMDIKLQAKILRALQERVIDRVGGTTPIPINIRVLATSNRNMQDTIQKGEFREDLYFRLNVINIHIPSLKERPLDIDVLSPHFISKYAALNGVPEYPLSQDALNYMKQYSWPGNVRELENRMHRAVLLTSGDEIEVSDIFELHIQNVFQNQSLSDIERETIFKTLRTCQGNRTLAANVLGISIRTLRNKLKEYSDHGFDLTLNSCEIKRYQL